MQYTPIHVGWYYSFVTIPRLDEIRQELINAEKIIKSGWSTNKIYRNLHAYQVLDICPVLKEYLQSVGLLYKVARFLYSVNMSENKSTPHVDSYDPAYCSESLNIPLINCSDSYTIWYETDRKELIDSSSRGLNPVSNFAVCPADEAREINKIETVLPMLVNTTILHRGETQNNARMLCGIRFKDGLTAEDCKNLGILEPFVQKD